jgi:hypothetical protein
VFIGSSSEGLNIAEHLHVALESSSECTVVVWNQGVFGASSYTLDSLLSSAGQCDFAILIASGDDTVESRGVRRSSARDNVIFELGLFMGILGRERTFIVSDSSPDLALPSDLNGVTQVRFQSRNDGNLRSALTSSKLQIIDQVKKLGRLDRDPDPVEPTSHPGTAELEAEIELICKAALAHGWKIKTRSRTVLRLINRKGRHFTLPLRQPEVSRAELRSFASVLRANGIRVSHAVRRPPHEGPRLT